jgi:hypothetical protein
MPTPRKPRPVQAWVELVSHDPQAVSALGVAKAHLAAGRDLVGLRRVRLIELEGRLPERARIEALLHRSIQFYNPRKERCTLRTLARDPAPLAPGERAMLVFERGEARRGAAERWWLHETGVPIEVREGVVWIAAFDDSVTPDARTAHLEDLALVRDRRSGLLCNPHCQECRPAGDAVPLPWIDEGRAPQKGRTTVARRTRKK